MELDARDIYSMRQALSDAALRGGENAALLSVTRASGVLPQGTSGEIAFGAAAREIQALAKMARDLAPGPPMEDRRAELEVGTWRVRGLITQQRGNRIVRIRPATVKATDLLRAWCHHLFACATAEPEARPSTLVLGTKESAMLQPVKDAPAELEKLLAFYAAGAREALQFFPAASLAYAAALAKGKAPDEARSAAARQWEAGDFSAGEGEDPWNRVLWRAPADPFSQQWEEISAAVFQPLLAHLEKVE
jgi:exodeoxyribonuclease V gamma subunit